MRGIERALCLPLGCLRGQPVAFVIASLNFQLAWVSALLPYHHRYAHGAGLSPPFLVGGELLVWVVKEPVWQPRPPIPHDHVLLYDHSVSVPGAPLVIVSLAEVFSGLRLSAVLEGPTCERCNRLCAAETRVVWTSLGSATFSGVLCSYLPPSLLVTQALAGLSYTTIGPHRHHGVVPTSLRRQCRCHVPPIAPLPGDLSRPVAPVPPPQSLIAFFLGTMLPQNPMATASSPL